MSADHAAPLRRLLFPLILACSAPLRYASGQAAPAAAEPSIGRNSLGLALGIIGFDQNGPGSAALGRVQYRAVLRSHLSAEAAVGYFREAVAPDIRRAYYLPDVMLQFHMPEQRLQPFVGLGATALIGDRPERDPGSGTRLGVVGAVGVRLNQAARLRTLQVEARGRSVGGDYRSVAYEATLGIARRF